MTEPQYLRNNIVIQTYLKIISEKDSKYKKWKARVYTTTAEIADRIYADQNRRIPRNSIGYLIGRVSNLQAAGDNFAGIPRIYHTIVHDENSTHVIYSPYNVRQGDNNITIQQATRTRYDGYIDNVIVIADGYFNRCGFVKSKWILSDLFGKESKRWELKPREISDILHYYGGYTAATDADRVNAYIPIRAMIKRLNTSPAQESAENAD